MSLGKQIRYYREKLNLTLEGLSALTDNQVDVGTISALENRNSQRSKFAPLLAKALGLSIEQLLDESRDWLDEAKSKPYPTSTVIQLARAEEPPIPPAWPFPDIDATKVAALMDAQISQLQGALLLTAAQLGVEIRKRAAA